METSPGRGATESAGRRLRAARHLHKTKQTAASVREKGTADAAEITSGAAWQRVQPLEGGRRAEEPKAGHRRPAAAPLGPRGVKRTVCFLSDWLVYKHRYPWWRGFALWHHQETD